MVYRSVTRELHAGMEGAAKVQSSYMSRVERGFDPANEPSPDGLLATERFLTSFWTYQYRGTNFDTALLARNRVEHDVIVFDDQPPCIAVSWLFSFDEILKENDILRIVLNVLPVNQRRIVVIFPYTKDDCGNARAMLDRVLSAERAYQKYELSKLILGAIENFLIAPAHFETWSAAKRDIIKNAFVSTVMARTKPAEHPDLMLF
jgi:hypothetical protein